MHIAINLISIQHNSLRSYSILMQQVIDNWCVQFPQHRFTVFLLSAPNKDVFQYTNCNVEVIPRKISTKWQAYKWYHITLPALLKKHEPQICIQPYGMASLRTKVPQIIWSDTVLHPYIFAPNRLGKEKHTRFFAKLFLKKASTIITSTAFVQSFIEQQYKISNKKITIVPTAISTQFQPIHWEKSELVKESYADAKAYYLFIASALPENNVMELLKAFSLFKKWQRSSMKLIITGLSETVQKDIATKLETYKYKEDVVLLSHQTDENLALIIAAAYGVVLTDAFDGTVLSIIAALQCGVPVITTNESAVVEITQNACLYTPINDIDALSKKMILLYKDEILRSSLIQKGLQIAEQTSVQKTAEQLFSIIEQANTNAHSIR